VRSLIGLTETSESAAESLFRVAYDRYFDRVHVYVRRLAGSGEHAEDVAQEVFVRLWRELLTHGAPPNTRAWLFRVAGNLVMSRFRVRARVWRFVQSALTVSPFASVDVEREAAHRQIVDRALKELPEPMRRCLLLHHEGLTAQEMADILGIRPGYVRTLVFRAHERFRRTCDALVGDGDDLFR
jgi:RNA polymerase sigma-70 factor (ECF subfamily)